MKRRYFTFLYVPDENKAPKHLRVSRALVYGLAMCLAVVIGISTWAVLRYGDKLHETYRLSYLEKENAVLKGKVDQYTHDLEKLQRQVAQNFDFQKKARLLAGLDEIDEDIAEVGVGGPSFTYVKSLSILDDETREKIEAIGGDLGKLLRQAKLQGESYWTILDTLSKTKDLRDATPTIRPVKHGFVSSRFGRRMDPFTGRLTFHRGVDYSVRKGAPIFSTADGVVVYTGKWSRFGQIVEISHGHGFVSRYAHVSKIFVKKGQRVKRGDIIARVGQTGKATAAHLHYEVLKDGSHKNPFVFMLSDEQIARY
ncbi:MAG: peptidoglycan DD-metalloendopeptidase family protein [Candidatus Latescibacteria bacterium]|nr:peptidoglycan DD-metalloendopeptidase family protein [Candidatus Latescibacterota bacterium]NIM21595.1 peptidoglycan DD-metalloendopeptidase family protein [Candidatus Latescibacterota bacterium]NIM64574.1 peptidoglycan DD-metalloendopeptidase family protein [Candidatus Latescibacterota bacterium]NIO01089.1 peptidoglycan DD-metalloendopeptidase family protein [Candidatus Latescibacterota bacterium]NIO27482.1 peptidoglycan DD-metalloendopeptidase family protein [Candidatus Latescibacterota ba